MTVTGVGVTLAPAQVEALLWACPAATALSRFPARSRGVSGGEQARLIVALTQPVRTEDDGSVHPVSGPCGRRWPICTCRDLRGQGPAQTAGPEWEGPSP
jgi:hypothetical protein